MNSQVPIGFKALGPERHLLYACERQLMVLKLCRVCADLVYLLHLALPKLPQLRLLRR